MGKDFEIIRFEISTKNNDKFSEKRLKWDL